MLMEGDPFLLIEGMIIAGIASGATKGFVYIRSEYPHAIAAMQRAIEVAREEGLLGARVLEFVLRASISKSVSAPAPMSAARRRRCSKVSKAAAGRCAPSRRCRCTSGLFGKPTIINNVLTFASVPAILDKGAAFYANFGMGRSRGTMPIQLAGDIKYGGLFETAFGVSLGELVNDIGGGTRSGRPVRAVQVGGPLGAYFPPSLFDTPFDYEAFAARDGLLGHGGVVVFNDTVDMAHQARFAMEFCAIESCGKCTPCRIGSVRGTETIDKIVRGQNVNANLTLLRDLCDTMKSGSLCALGGFVPYPVLSALNHFPQDFVS